MWLVNHSQKFKLQPRDKVSQAEKCNSRSRCNRGSRFPSRQELYTALAKNEPSPSSVIRPSASTCPRLLQARNASNPSDYGGGANIYTYIYYRNLYYVQLQHLTAKVRKVINSIINISVLIYCTWIMDHVNRVTAFGYSNFHTHNKVYTGFIVLRTVSYIRTTLWYYRK